MSLSGTPAGSPTDKTSVPDEIRNLADTVRRSAARTPAAPALITPGTMLTWSELDAAADRMASGLRQLGLSSDPGSSAPVAARVAIALPNVVDFAVAFFGVLRAGLIAVPTNPAYTARELHHVLGDSGAKVLVGTAAVLHAVTEIRGELSELRHVYTGGGAVVPGVSPMSELLGEPGPAEPGPAESGPAEPGPAEPGPAEPAATSGAGEDIAVLLYTSGTAGAPKGAMLTHRALIANHRQVDQVEPAIVSQGDVVLLALPLFHAFGLNSGLVSVAWHGACGVLVERFDPAETLALIARHQVSVVTAVPQMYLAWSLLPALGESLGTVRVAVSGAAPLDRATARRFLEASSHPLFEGYGLTETAPVVATALASPQPKIGSIGRPLPGIEVRLVAVDGTEICRLDSSGLAAPLTDDFDDDAGGVPGTDPGEIVVRGPNLFSGYWPDGSDGPDADGWWPTGDIAYADEDGDLFLVDRLGELILVSGFNVYPHEIELVLASHPAVAEVAVVGVPNPYTGETVKAVVVPRGTATTEDLLAHCERNLARFKCPTIIEFVAHLPYSATGKVRKGSLVASEAEAVNG